MWPATRRAQKKKNRNEGWRKIGPPIHTEYFHLGWSNHLDLGREWCERRVFVRHALNNLLEHGGAACQHDTAYKFLRVNAALHVALERRVVGSTGSFNNEIWLQQHFHVKETFSVDSDDVSVCENVLDLIVDGASAVSLFVMRSTIPWKMAVPPDGTTLTHTYLLKDVNVTLHVVLGRSAVDSGKRLEQHFDATETFSTDSADVSVWELVSLLVVTVRGRFELDGSDDVFVWEHAGLLLVCGCSRFVLCVVLWTHVAQYLFDIWNNLPLCNGSERVPWLSEDLHQLHCNITASETKDGERQSETFVDEHCARHAVRVSHNVRRAS